MSLLKVNNNPRSLLRKAEEQNVKKVVTIRSKNSETQKVIVDIVKPANHTGKFQNLLE